MKPILTRFKEAGRLVNEWRDSLYYASLPLAASMEHHFLPSMSVPASIVGAVLGRELIRFSCWSMNASQIHLVGAPTTSVDPFPNAEAAGLTTSILAAGFILTSHHVLGINSLTSIVVATPIGIIGTGTYYGLLQARGTGMREFLKIYGKMWDWARQNGGNGPTQTRKLFQAFDDSVSSRRSAPQLTPAPIRVRPSRRVAYPSNLSA